MWPVPAFGQVIYLSFLSLSAFPAQMGNLEPLGTNEKMKGIATIIALVPCGLWWEAQIVGASKSQSFAALVKSGGLKLF